MVKISESRSPVNARLPLEAEATLQQTIERRLMELLVAIVYQMDENTQPGQVTNAPWRFRSAQWLR
jgi:hypothetical protein